MGRSVGIHSWGGLGSQLFALALAIDLEPKFSGRLVIVCHSSGVTKREPELKKYCSLYPVVAIDDFIEMPSNPRNGVGDSFITFIRNMLRRTLVNTGYLAECNTDKQFQKLRPWVRALRGHYSYRIISVETLSKMDKALFPSNGMIYRGPTEPRLLTIHYRLGDLLSLSNKSFVDRKRLSSAMNNIISKYDLITCEVASDSPSRAIHELRPLLEKSTPLTPLATNSLSTIRQLQRAKVFIGTNSKLSIWIAVLRLHYGHFRETWVPIELKGHLQAILNADDSSTYLHYY